jgi:hypothetical protein
MNDNTYFAASKTSEREVTFKNLKKYEGRPFYNGLLIPCSLEPTSHTKPFEKSAQKRNNPLRLGRENAPFV